MSTEKWLPVVGWEGYYSISDLGRVRSESRTVRHAGGGLYTVGGHLLSVSPARKNYPCVNFSRNGKHKTQKVHLLVLKAFRGPCPAGMECRHLDGNAENRALSNLEWGTPKENGEDRVRHGTSSKVGRMPIGAAHHNAKLTVAKAAAIKEDPRPPVEIAAENGLHPATVRLIKNGRNWSAAIREYLANTSTTN